MDYKFLYSIGADCDMDDEMKKVGANDFSTMMLTLGTAQTYAKLGAILSKWYCMAHGGEAVTEEQFMLLPAGELDHLASAINKAMADGQKQEMKTKSKNAKGAARSK